MKKISITTTAIALFATIAFVGCSSAPKDTTVPATTDAAQDAATDAAAGAKDRALSEANVAAANELLKKVEVSGFEFGVTTLPAKKADDWIAMAKPTITDTLGKIPDGSAFVITGHADAKGTDEANALISKARADYIKSRMAAAGINTKNMKTKGVGATRLKDSGNPESGTNRRVTFSIDPK